MTRKEAIEQLKVYRACMLADGAEVEAYNMAIQALGQEPCDDVISREYLFKVLDDFCGHDRTATITLDTLADLVYDMPSVKPQESKTGKWIAQDIHNCHTDFKCSECGYIHSFMHLYGEPTADYTYCPNCGAKMESEVIA